MWNATFKPGPSDVCRLFYLELPRGSSMNYERFPFNQNFRFEFSGNFQKRMEQHFSVDCTGNDDFPTFPKTRTASRSIPKFSKKISRKFSFHSTLLPKFLKFSVEWFAFRKFNSFRNFWKLFQEISVPFAAVSKFSKVLVEWKAYASVLFQFEIGVHFWTFSWTKVCLVRGFVAWVINPGLVKRTFFKTE